MTFPTLLVIWLKSMKLHPHFMDFHLLPFHFARCSPIANSLECDCGICTVRHCRLGMALRLDCGAELTRRAKRPCGARKLAARGRVLSNFSTARKVTTSAGGSTHLWGGARADSSLRSEGQSSFIGKRIHARDRG